MLARLLEAAWWHGHPVFLYLFSVVSFLIFHSQELTKGILDPDEICSMAVETKLWLLPKLSTDCTLLATTLSSHPYKDVAILLNYWNLAVFLLSIIVGTLAVVMGTRNFALFAKGFQHYGRARRWVVTIIMIFGIFASTWYVVFHSTLVIEGTRYAWAGTLSSYGLGAAFQTFISGIPCLTFSMILETIFRKKIEYRAIRNEQRQ